MRRSTVGIPRARIVQGEDGVWRSVEELEEKKRVEELEKKRAEKSRWTSEKLERCLDVMENAIRAGIAFSGFREEILSRHVGVFGGRHWFSRTPTESDPNPYCNGTYLAVELKEKYGLAQKVASVWREANEVLISAGVRIKGEHTRLGSPRDPEGVAVLAEPETWEGLEVV